MVLVVVVFVPAKGFGIKITIYIARNGHKKIARDLIKLHLYAATTIESKSTECTERILPKTQI